MTIEQNIFKRAKVVFSKLAEYGFEKSAEKWIYNQIFMNGEFKATVQIDADGNISGEVYETDSEDIYFPLRVESMAAGFAGEVRAEYEKILQGIKENCCQINYFIGAQTNRLALKIYEKHGDNPCFPWDKFDGYGVFKNPDNNKWYALIMNLNAAKLNKQLYGEIEAVNIKLAENKIPDLIKQNGFYPAYHMNKKNWITVVLDGSVNDDLLFALVDESYSFTLGKRGKIKSSGVTEWLIPANPRYFDIEAAFEKQTEIIWKQSSTIKVGDIAYMYVGAPISAILYKCEVTAVNIPYDYADKNLKITRVMKIKQLKKYAKDFMPFARLKELGINSVRGPRICPKHLADKLK